MIWTRLTTDDEAAEVEWLVASDPSLDDVVASGTATALAGDDHTVHVDVTGLEPATVYHYAFVSGGERSDVGRTRTLGADRLGRVRFATCSCAKFNAGYFNAYARIADRGERGDIDFLLHLGDYVYEASNTPPKSQTPGADIGRAFEPLGECRTLAEYRTRYAQYHRDPDVMRLHHALPLIPALDDHELADGAWAGGADAHDEAEHGPWSARRAAALRARWEWLPIRPPDRDDPSRIFRRVQLGGLADIILLDIRSRRDRPTAGPEMADPDRTMLGDEQRAWLHAELERSTAAWRFVASPSIFTTTWTPEPAEPLRTALLKLKLINADGAGPDEDQWDGYPAEREALLDRLRSGPPTILLSADIHISAVSEVRDDGETIAIEVTAPSLTSQNLDDKLKVPPRDDVIVASERAYMEALDHVRWCEFASHGYCVIEIDRDHAVAEWWHVDGVLEPLAGERLGAAFRVERDAPTPVQLPT